VSKKADPILIIPGEVTLAMLMAMIDVRGWLETEMIKKWCLHKHITEEKKVEKSVAIGIISTSIKHEVLEGPESIGVELLEFKPLKGPFGGYARFFKVSAGYEEDVYEFKVEVYRRIFGLASALTDRELEILDKRLIQRKTVTETATEMNITSQAVSAFMTAIRTKVHKYLFKKKA